MFAIITNVWTGPAIRIKLQGSAIPLLARILSVVDVYDALTSDRPYRSALSREQAFRELREEAARGDLSSGPFCPHVHRFEPFVLHNRAIPDIRALKSANQAILRRSLRFMFQIGARGQQLAGISRIRVDREPSPKQVVSTLTRAS